MQPDMIEQTYRKLSIELHPDKADYDSQDDFIAMKAEYDAIRAIRKHWAELDSFFRNIYYRPQTQNPPAQTFDFQSILADGLNFMNETTKLVKEGNKIAKNVNKAIKSVG